MFIRLFIIFGFLLIVIPKSCASADHLDTVDNETSYNEKFFNNNESYYYFEGDDEYLEEDLESDDELEYKDEDLEIKTMNSDK